MISVTEAKKIVRENITPLLPVRLSVGEAGGMVLAEDVYAATDIPAFPQSSMDGYALSYDGWQLHKKLKIEGEIAAGTNDKIVLAQQNAVRIFTGAAVPPGADTVVMQEKVITENGHLIIEDENLRRGTNVRPKGSEIKAGELALPGETWLSPAAIGFLAGIGTTEVTVYPKPVISIIITGNELQEPGRPLQYGQVYESNSFTLKAVLEQAHLSTIKIYRVGDKPEAVTNILEKALQETDIVLLTGGISVGDYDFVLQAAGACGVRQLFHKVKQRPGKPLYFGKKQNKPVFGLPGNPSSVLSCFYNYVLPALEQMSKHSLSLQTIQVSLAKAISKSAGLTHFLKGFYDGHTVIPLDAQESYRLSSFARANCLVQVNEETTECKEGETVTIHLLPV